MLPAIYLGYLLLKIGEPNGWFGSGILRPYYSLSNGTYVICSFNSPQIAQDLKKLELVDDSKVLEIIKEAK